MITLPVLRVCHILQNLETLKQIYPPDELFHSAEGWPEQSELKSAAQEEDVGGTKLHMSYIWKRLEAGAQCGKAQAGYR